MTKKYYVKLKINYKDNFYNHLAVISIYGNSVEEVRLQAIQHVELWNNFKTATIEDISSSPMYVYNYFIESKLKYKNGNVKYLKFNITAENKENAEKEFRKIIKRWKKVVAFEILEIDFRTQQPHQE
ncbi:MAG: hypothetical protein L3J54_02240 [Draconibacterium sp.]|nr:hypothetical protein [Draconibacterium sp.]